MSRRHAALVAVVAAAASGCGSRLVDPCAGVSGACIGVHVDGAVSVDQLVIAVGTLGMRSVPEQPTPLSLPVRFAIALPPTTDSSLPLTLDGFAAGTRVATAAAAVALVGGRGSADLTLVPAGPLNGGDDLAASSDDLAVADDLAMHADLASTDMAQNFVVTAATMGGLGALTVNGDTCSSSCARIFPAGTTITIAQTAGAGSSFANWSGACTGGVNPCVFTLTSDGSVTANYTRTGYILTWVPFSIGAISGTVNVSGGTSCGSLCRVYTAGTSVTVSTTPGTNAALFAYGGDCKGQTSTCTILMNADHSFTASFYDTTKPPNLVFVTSADYTVTQLGSSGANADGLCQSLASAASLANATTFKAWLSTTSVGALSKLGSASGWVRKDGMPFTSSLGSPAGGSIAYPVLFDEMGNSALGRAAWTGTDGNGNATTNCVDWTATDLGHQGIQGVPYGTNTAWTARTASPPANCNSTAALYCFGTQYTTGFAYSTTINTGARHVFTSTGTINGAAGIAAADTLCQQEATAAGLTGSYLAFMQTAAPGGGLARFDTATNLGPWLRADGAILAPVSFAFAPASLWTAPDRLAGNIIVANAPFYDWIGRAPDTSTHSCNDWTSTTASGSALGVDSLPLGGSSSEQNCASALRVLCMQR